MKALKRFLTAVLVCVMVLGCVPFGAAAETDHGPLLKSPLTKYYERTDAVMEYGYFSEGELPCMAFIYKQINLASDGMFFGDYCITTTIEEGYKRYTYEIPADAFEEAVFDIFSKTDETLSVLRSGKEYMTDREEPYYRIEGLDIDLEPSDEYGIEYVGYRELEDGSVETWLYVVGGTDVSTGRYISRPSKISDHSTKTPYGGIGFCYGTLRVRHAVRSIADIEDGAVTIRSFEKADVSDVPGDIKVYDVPDKLKMDGAYMHTTAEAFGIGTEVYCDNSNEDRTINSYAKESLSGVEKYVSGYKFAAISRGEEIQPKLPVTVEFKIPGTINTDVRVYKLTRGVPEEGSYYPVWEYELMEFTVNETERTVTAVIDDFDCIYAVGGESKDGSGDANSDGKINITDVSFMLKYIAKWEGLGVDPDVADVTGDGKVNLTDATKLLRYIADREMNWF